MNLRSLICGVQLFSISIPSQVPLWAHLSLNNIISLLTISVYKPWIFPKKFTILKKTNLQWVIITQAYLLPLTMNGGAVLKHQWACYVGFFFLQCSSYIHYVQYCKNSKEII